MAGEPTPLRYTRLVLQPGGPQVHVLRDSWGILRWAQQICQRPLEQSLKQGVTYHPAGAWTLAFHLDDQSRVIDTEYATGLGAALSELAENWSEIQQYKKPDETGIEPAGSVIASGVPGFRKRVPAGGSFDTDLAADAAAFPLPTLETADIPMNRVLAGLVSYPRNKGFAFNFLLSRGLGGPLPDTICSFYFGGQCDSLPVGTYGGAYCFTLRGSGEGQLRELLADNTWAIRRQYQVFNPDSQGDLVAINTWLIPYGLQTITFKVTKGDLSGINTPFFSTLAAGAQFGSRPGFYRVEPQVTRYIPITSVTGPGVVRMDVRRDLRGPYSIVPLKPAAQGFLPDEPFHTRELLAAGSIITLRLHAQRPEGTTLIPHMYGASTGTELTRTGGPVLWAYETLADEQRYYVIFEFNSDEDQEQTPVLYGCNVDSPQIIEESNPTPIVLQGLESVSITGPDWDTDQDSAMVKLHSLYGNAESLTYTSRIHAKINVYDSTDDSLISTIFEGESVRPDAEIVGNPAHYPNFKKFSVPFVGMWTKIDRYVSKQHAFFSQDTTAPLPMWVNGNPPPRKVTSVLSEVLQTTGFAADQVNIPDLPLRLWVLFDSKPGDWMWQAGQPATPILKRLCQDFLNATLVWCPNSGSRGQWRLIPNPRRWLDTLCTFYRSGQIAKYQSSAGAYTGGTFIRRGTYHQVPLPASANVVTIVGYDSVNRVQIPITRKNPAGFNFYGTADRDHIDYLGDLTEIHSVQPSLQTLEAVLWFSDIMFRRSCHGRLSATFQAPLYLVTDATDTALVRPRPLRFGDPIDVEGERAWVRSCNPAWDRSDKMQWMNMEIWYARADLGEY